MGYFRKMSHLFADIFQLSRLILSLCRKIIYICWPAVVWPVFWCDGVCLRWCTNISGEPAVSIVRLGDLPALIEAVVSFEMFGHIHQTTWQVKEWKTNLMSLAILFHFLCAQYVSDINISVIRNLRLCCWITTSVVLFSVRCVLEIWCSWFWVVFVLQAEVLQPAKRAPPKTSRTKSPTHNELRTRRPMW